MQRSRNNQNRSQKRDNRPRKYSNSGSEDESREQERFQNRNRNRKESNSPSESKSVSPSRSRSRSRSASESNSDRNKNQRGGNRQQPQRKSGDDCSELFVRNLPWKASEEDISDFFAKFGKVQNVKILYNRDTGKAKGIGFVDFVSREDAQNAIDNAADLEMDGRKLEVSFSNQKEQNNNRNDNRRDDRRDNRRDNRRENSNAESNTIFVGNLDFKTSENTIRDFFDDCGGISDVRIAKTPEGKNKGFCHVEFESTEAAAKAMKKAGENIDGRDIRVDFSGPRKEGGNRDRGFGNRGGFRGGNSKKYFWFFN